MQMPKAAEVSLPTLLNTPASKRSPSPLLIPLIFLGKNYIFPLLSCFHGFLFSGFIARRDDMVCRERFTSSLYCSGEFVSLFAHDLFNPRRVLLRPTVGCAVPRVRPGFVELIQVLFSFFVLQASYPRKQIHQRTTHLCTPEEKTQWPSPRRSRPSARSSCC